MTKEEVIKLSQEFQDEIEKFDLERLDGITTYSEYEDRLCDKFDDIYKSLRRLRMWLNSEDAHERGEE